MDKPVLTDQNQFPEEEIIFSYIGKSKPLWASFFREIHQNHPDFAEEWKYYNDGKCWLLKVTRKSKTIFWLSVISNSFRTTFYFPDKAEEAINKSNIADELKKQYRDKKGNKFRGITIVYKNKSDVNAALKLIDLKLNFK